MKSGLWGRDIFLVCEACGDGVSVPQVYYLRYLHATPARRGEERVIIMEYMPRTQNLKVWNHLGAGQKSAFAR